MGMAALASSALVQMMVTDGWEGVRDKVIRLFGHGELNGQIERRLDAARRRLIAAAPDRLERLAAELAGQWETRFADLLADHPDVATDLADLISESRAQLSLSAGDHSIAAGGDVNISANGGVAAGVIHGSVMLPGHLGAGSGGQPVGSGHVGDGSPAAGMSAGRDVIVSGVVGAVTAASIGAVQVTAPQLEPVGRPVSLPPRPALLAGREQFLAELHTRLTATDRTGPRVVALHGMGGAGKTTVAVEYAYRILAAAEIAWQFSAENPAVLASEFARLAGLLGVHHFLDGRDPVGAVHAVLATGAASWLLIFDNVPDAAAVARFLPPAGRGSIVITSQNPHWPSDQAMDVPVLSADDAARFLAARTGSADDEPAAAALAAELGGLPLALEQAAAYILASGSTLAGYLELFRHHRAGLLARGDPHGYGKTIATTWSLAFTELDQQAPQAAALLRLLACCAPEPVPVGTLLRVAPGTATQLAADIGRILAPLLRDELAANDAIAELRRYSLITFAGHGQVLMHRLVQAATVDRMTARQADLWRQAAAALVEAALPHDPKVARDWPTFAALLPHAKAVLGEGSAGLARVVDYLGWSGDISAACDQLTVLLAAQKRILGADHQVTLATSHDLACWTGQAGDPGSARDRLAASLPAAERALGSEHATTLLTRHSLAYWTGRAGDAAAARDQFAALLPVRERVLGPEHPDTLATRSSLASWIGQAADPSAAARDQLIAQPVSGQNPGPAARGDTATQNDLASWVGQAAAPAAAACDQLTILLPIRERILGHDHPTTLLTRHELARWTGEAGHPAAARDQLADLLPDRERELGPRHPDSLATRSYLARWTGLAGDAVAARDQLADLLPERERVLGPRHPDTLVTRHNLAHWTGQAGDPVAARDQLADLLPDRERVLGPRHPDTLVTRHNLAHWTGQAGDPAAARDQIAALQPDIEQVFGPDHPITTAARTTHAWWTQQAVQAADQQPPCQS